MWLRIKSFFFSNRSHKQILLKNTFWLGLIEFFSKIIMFVVTVLIVRSFGPENFGRLNIAFSYVAIFMVLSDFGLNTISTREIAKNPQKKQKYFSNVFTIKLLISFLLIILSFILSPILHADPFIQKLFILTVIFNLIQNLTNFFCAVFSGLEIMEFVFTTRIIHYLGLFVSAIFVTQNRLGLDILLVAYIVTNMFMFIITLLMFKKRKIELSFSFDFVFWKKIMKETLPLLGITVATSIYLNNDTILIGRYFGPQSTGLYQSAYKILFAFLSVNIVNTALFPRISALIQQKSYQTLSRLIRFILSISLIILIPLAMIITVFSKQIMNVIYGPAYISAGTALIFLIWAGVVNYFRTFTGNFLIASGRQRIFFYAFFAGTILNLVLNLFLTPKFGYIFCSFSLLISELLITMVSIFILRITNKQTLVKIKKIRKKFYIDSKPIFLNK